MSEFQYVVFRAVDAPVSKKNLEYMEKQSSRAEITPWSFKNEYSFGDFHGDALGMLQRGYDVHLHYANFGVRRLMIRLPHGLPNSERGEKYFIHKGMQLHRDETTCAVVLEISPYLEPDQLEEVYEFEELVEGLIRLRTEIMEGDLRPLYLGHLTMCLLQFDEESTEAPVPYGLTSLTAAQSVLADFYGIEESLLRAAADGIPEYKNQKSTDDGYLPWLQKQTTPKKDIWLGRIMADVNSNVRAEILAEFLSQKESTSWPVVERNKKIVDLQAEAKKFFSKKK